MATYQLGKLRPRLAESAWVAASAQVIGDVLLEADVSVWFGAVLRGDNASISVGAGSNIQDSCVLHVDANQPLYIGQGVTIGHRAVLHSCSVADYCLIGIGAVLLNGAKIGAGCLVGAGSLVTEGKQFAPGSLILGSPAKAVRQLSAQQLQQIRHNAQSYIDKARLYQNTCRPIS